MLQFVALLIISGLVFCGSLSSAQSEIESTSQAAIKYIESHRAVFNREHFREVMALRQDLTRVFPPQKYHYLFIGRSMGLLEVALDAVRIDYSYLPLTLGRLDVSLASDGEIRQGFHFVDEAKKNQFLEHIDEYTRDMPKDKPIVLIDYSYSGRTMSFISSVFERYFPERRYVRYIVSTRERFDKAKKRPDFIDRFFKVSWYFIEVGSRIAGSMRYHTTNELSQSREYPFRELRLLEDPLPFKEPLRKTLARFFQDLEFNDLNKPVGSRSCRSIFFVIP